MSDQDDVNLLVLGDGDFSFSLDWVRYLQQLNSQKVYAGQSLNLVATGLDSKEALLAKYKDCTFLLKNLQDCDNKPRAGSSNTSLRVSVRHGVNAVIGNCRTSEIPPAHHAIFHHPHLGTEDALLHAQFLCHLFHSVATSWLVSNSNERSESNGYFHLTLVNGQFERWKCHEAAVRHGMELIDQRTFRPPIAESGYYQRRRHQTGKSFAARTPKGSTTYTFVRRKRLDKNHPGTGKSCCDQSSFIATLLGLNGLPSGNENDKSEKKREGVGGKCQEEKDLFSCPFCDKRFQEERSRKCHVRDVHGEGGKKRKLGAVYPCHLCQAKDGGGPRIFPTAQALDDHQKAKHAGLHDNIKPDWYKRRATDQLECNENESGPSSKQFGECRICGVQFDSPDAQQSHLEAFVPSDVQPFDKDPISFRCTYCKKAFRELRAQEQHENFCKEKGMTTSQFG